MLPRRGRRATSAAMNERQAAIFDLDGVLVDTARHHYAAWKRLAAELGFDFTEAQNERLKGVSRDESLRILLECGGLERSAEERKALAERKNRWYVEMLSGLTEADLLPGSMACLTRLKAMGIPAALASASKNAPMILRQLAIADLFRAVVDGNSGAKVKPDPELFLMAAAKMRIEPRACVVFEDAAAGIEAAHAAGMYAVGVGRRSNLPEADIIVPDLAHCDLAALFPA